MENEVIMKSPHYSLSVLSSIKKINILTSSLEMNPKKMIHAEGGFRMPNIYDISNSSPGVFCVQVSCCLRNLDNQFLYASTNASVCSQNAPNKQGWSLSTREYFIVI